MEIETPKVINRDWVCWWAVEQLGWEWNEDDQCWRREKGERLHRASDADIHGWEGFGQACEVGPNLVENFLCLSACPMTAIDEDGKEEDEWMVVLQVGSGIPGNDSVATMDWCDWDPGLTAWSVLYMWHGSPEYPDG